MAPVIFALHHVHKVYDTGTIALQDMNLSVAPGQFISLVGPSGCGKSTVLRLLAGLEQPSQGHLDRPKLDRPDQLAYVFQEPALLPWATVTDNVALPLKLGGQSPRQRREAVADVLARVGLSEFGGAYPRELSGGMRMRVSIARALVTQPQILLMDEPFGALDEITRTQLNEELLELWQRQRWTVVFVTHNLYEAVYLSSRVVVMATQPGRSIAEIPIELPYPRQPDLRTSPQCNRYCRDILHLLHPNPSYRDPK